MPRGVLLVGALPPPSGGVATHVVELAAALAREGLRVNAIDPRRRGPDGRDGRPRLAWALLHARARGDLVHVHTNGHNPKSWALAAACSVGRPALLTLHSGLAPAFMRAHKKVVRILCARFMKIIAVNAELAEALGSCGVRGERVIVCAAYSAGAAPLRLAPPGLGSLRRRHALLIACALAPGHEYGADVMLDGFARVRERVADAALVLYGPGTRAPTLAADAAARGLGGAIYFLGELPRARALAVAAAADLFVRPTRADGDALSVREALALGRPVVASDVGARPSGVTLFTAGDGAALAEKIFQTVGKPMGNPDPPEDCLPALLALYRRCGAAAASPRQSARRSQTP